MHSNRHPLKTQAVSEWPASMGNVDITETTAPVETEAGAPSAALEFEPESTRRILIKILFNARLEMCWRAWKLLSVSLQTVNCQG